MEAQGSSSSTEKYRPHDLPQGEEDKPVQEEEDITPQEDEEEQAVYRTKQEAYEARIRESLSPIDKQHAPIPNVSKRIHIVGTGSIGKLVAHSLRGIPNPPPVTLIFHRYRLLQQWRNSKQEIVVQDGEFAIPRGGFDFELQPVGQQQHGVDIPHGTPSIFELADSTGLKPHEAARIVAEQRAEKADEGEEGPGMFKPITTTFNIAEPFLPTDIIHNLIVCTKTIRTVVALSRLRHRLNAQSTICFLQNGMGVIEDVNKQIFPDPATRPNYVQGIITHGVNTPPERSESDPFYVVHAGHGSIALGIVPRETLSPKKEEDESEEAESSPQQPPKPVEITKYYANDPTVSTPESITLEYPPSARHLIRTLTRTPVLAAVAHTPHELLQLQLEKLAVNSVLNSLTSLIDARNGALLANHELLRTTRLLLAETSLIFRSIPELRGLPNTNSRFSPERLERLVLEVARKTGDNVSSMLADVRAGRLTEVGYINGYIVRRGEEVGVKAVVNYSVMCLVQGKRRVVQREREGEVEVQGGREGENVE